MAVLPIETMLKAMREASPRDLDPSLPLMMTLLQVMTWPKEPNRAISFLKHQHLGARELVDGIPEAEHRAEVQDALDHHLKLLGGWRSLGDSGSYRDLMTSFQSHNTRADWAGAVLCFAFFLHRNHSDQVGEHISLRKLWALVYRLGDQFFPVPPQPRAIREAWEDFHSVAHLWAAKFFMDRWLREEVYAPIERATATPAKPGPLSDTEKDSEVAALQYLALIAPHWTKHLLVLAHAFQDFGATFKPWHASKSMLDPNRLMLVGELPCDWEIEYPNLVFRDESLEALSDG